MGRQESMDYDDFRIEVTPRTDPGTANQWRVRLIGTPDDQFIGTEDERQPVTFTQEMLQQLRSPHGRPHPTLVRAVGTAVWQTLMGPNLAAAFRTLRATRKNAGRGLRLVTLLRGSDGEGQGLNPMDLPIEAMFDNN